MQLLQDAGMSRLQYVTTQVQLQQLIIQVLMESYADGDAKTHRCSGCQGRWTRQGRDPEPALCQQTLICHIGQCPAITTKTLFDPNASCYISVEVRGVQ